MLLRSRSGSLGSICSPLAIFAGGHGGRIRCWQRLAALGKPVLGSRVDRLQQFLHHRPMDVGQYLNTELVEQRTELDSRLLGNVAVQARLLAALAARGVQVSLLDGAVSGDTTAGGLARLDWVLAGGAKDGGGADAAIVELGANDGLRGSDPAAMEANLNAILDKLAARHIKVLLTGMHALPNLGRDYADAYDAVFKRLSRRPEILYDPFFLEGVAGDPALNQADGIHPNPEGVRRIVARITPLVERLLQEARKEK